MIVTNDAELSSAVASAIGGEVIQIAPGNYTETWRILDKAWSPRVTFEPLDPNGPPTFGFTKHERSSGFIIRGLNFDGVGTGDGQPGAVELRGCSDVDLIGNTIKGGESALKVLNSSSIRSERVLVEGNTLSDCGADEIKFGGCNDLTIRNNWLMGVFDPGPGAHGDRIQGAGSSNNVLIEGNICFFNFRDEPPGTKLTTKIHQGFFFDNGYYDGLTIRQNFVTHTGVNGIADGGSGSTFANVLIENNAVINVPSRGNPHVTGDYPADALNEASSLGIDQSLVSGSYVSRNNVGQSGAQLVIQKDDPAAPNFYNSVYQNIMRGMGYVLEDFRPVAGGPADFGTGMGPEQRLSELFNTGEPEMPDTIVSLAVDQALLDDDSDALAAGAIVDWNPARTPDPMIITPPVDYVGDIRVGYTVTDGEGLTDSATVVATFSGTAPQANDDFVSGPKNQPIGLDPLLNDTAD